MNLDSDSVKRAFHVDVIRVRADNDNHGSYKILVDMYVPTSSLLVALTALETHGDFPHSTRLLLTKPPGCTDAGSIIRDVLAFIPEAEFSEVSLDFQSDRLLEGMGFSFDVGNGALYMSGIKDYSIFTLPFFKSGPVEEIVMEAGSNSQEDIANAIKGIKKAGIYIKNEVRKKDGSVSVYI